MIKKLIMMVLMVCLIGLSMFANQEEEKEPATISLTWGSRYVLYGLDFLPQNKDLFMLGFNIPVKNFSFGPYVVPGDGYGEAGCYIGYNLQISKKASVTTAVIPLAWQYEGQDFEMAVIANATLSFQALFNPTLEVYYVNMSSNPELNGFHFGLGISETTPGGFDFRISISYNKEFFFPKGMKGFGGMYEISKTIEVAKKLFMKGSFQYWLIDRKLNENEPVLLFSLTHEF